MSMSVRCDDPIQSTENARVKTSRLKRLQEEISKTAALHKELSDQKHLISSLRAGLEKVQNECNTEQSRNYKHEGELCKLQNQKRELTTENSSHCKKMRKLRTCSVEQLGPMFRTTDAISGNKTGYMNITTVGEKIESEAAGLNEPM